jgi:hypothetical protein
MNDFGRNSSKEEIQDAKGSPAANKGAGQGVFPEGHGQILQTLKRL